MTILGMRRLPLARSVDRLRQTGAVMALGLAFGWLQACTTNPATGRSDFTPFMSPSDEIKVGGEQHGLILSQFGGSYQDPKIQGYVNDLGQRLAAKSELSTLKWTFTVLDSDIINAFALPGGYVYVSRGLVALADNEDQLAGVIGHEIGHVTARHAANRYSAAVGSQIGVTGAAILSDIFLGGGSGRAISQAGGAAAQSYLAGYSRGQELESDSLGVRYLDRIDYDTAAMAGFLDKLGRESALLAKLQGQTPRGFSYLDTHPPTDERVRKATALAAKTPGSGTPGSPRAFLDKIDGLVYGDSSAQGFRRGREFAHPGLRLAFEVPPGFFMLNFPDKLVASGPDGTTLIFDGGEKPWQGTPEDYLTKQWAPKLRLQGVEQVRANGLKAATGYTQVRTNSGTSALRLAVISWPDGRVYRLQMLAPPDKFRQYDPAFKAAITSFRQLSASEAGALKPYRVRPYRVRRSDTVASLSARLPFTKLAEERFRVLNGLNETDTLRPGTWIKTVAAR
jgi:predicted Zn-dependent protease